ncbi:MAG: prolipoprotein diacylglyceryl transferase [Tepidisphaeraceae bacterium]
MYQELFRIPYLNVPIYGYGVMLVVGFLLALELVKFLARRAGLDPEVCVNAGLIALVSGVIGARLSHVLENWQEFTRPDVGIGTNLWNAINIRSGGLTFYGGMILAFPVTLAYGIWKKMPLRRGMDIFAPCIMVGLGFGRIGCFLNGCCYGAQCDAGFPLGVHYPADSTPYLDQLHRGEICPLALHSLPVHPAQLYSTFTSLLVAAVLVSYFSLKPSPGRVMALMLMLEGVTRFLLELIRSEPAAFPASGLSWSLSMYIGLLLAIAGALLWIAFADRKPALTPAAHFTG